MLNVLSYCEARAARLKQSLATLAARREGAIVRRRGGRPIRACRIFCREQVVVLIDRYGVQIRLGYDDILEAVPIERVPANALSDIPRMREIAVEPTQIPADEDHASNVIVLQPAARVVFLV
jgi:hypothetical protein